MPKLRDLILKSYKYVLWGYGYRFFTRFRLYRFAGSSGTKATPGAFRILTFHDVRASEYESFERLIDYLLEAHGIITPAEAELRLTGEMGVSNERRIPCLLTFDDGFESNVRLARDILSKRRLTAIFFVCPELIDLPLEKHRGAILRYIYEGFVSEAHVPESAKFMSWEDARELVRLGHKVGSHTLTHSRLSSLNGEDQRREIVDSADRLEKMLGVPIEWFAFPFGDLPSIDANSVRVAQQRYRFCCSGLRGLNSNMTSPVELLREAVDLSSPVELQHLVVAGGMDFRHRAKVKKLTKLITPAVSESC